MKLLGVELGAPPEARGTLGRLLERNKALRDVFAADPALQRQLQRLQKWQSRRLLRSHADLHANPRYRLAVEFFFNELYGPDARRRDADMMKVQRAMERLLPREGLEALCCRSSSRRCRRNSTRKWRVPCPPAASRSSGTRRPTVPPAAAPTASGRSN